ncbi:MAG: hypothetical protein LBJ00_02580 [Planctomycetaceae bacterium]|nr:hypothetical protein [Planctomycetaceae bacterium]
MKRLLKGEAYTVYFEFGRLSSTEFEITCFWQIVFLETPCIIYQNCTKFPEVMVFVSLTQRKN